MPNFLVGTLPSAAGGTLTYSFTASADPGGGGGWSATGTYVFTNWIDPTTGYTINGTINISASVGVAGAFPLPIVIILTGDLTFAGAPISTLKINVTTNLTFHSADIFDFTLAVTGTITADGKSFDVASLE